jgi:hypothetical protein
MDVYISEAARTAFCPEEGGSMFLRNVDESLPNYTVLIPEDSTLHSHYVKTSSPTYLFVERSIFWDIRPYGPLNINRQDRR